MTSAFHGDPALKAEVLHRLRQHAAAGTLVPGPTLWDGTRGSPMGVSAHSEDSAVYAALFGFPLPLAGLLDPITADDARRCAAVAIEWSDCVAPGADLSAVPLAIVQDVLEQLDAPRLAADHYGRVVALHRRPDATAAEWRRLRTAIEDAAGRSEGDGRTALNACAIASWPLATSRSVLVELMAAWRTGARPPADPDWDESDTAHAHERLEMLWNETAPQRDAGQPVDLPALFRQRDPDLAARFEANLARVNAAHLDRVGQGQALVLRHLATAGSERAAD